MLGEAARESLGAVNAHFNPQHQSPRSLGLTE